MKELLVNNQLLTLFLVVTLGALLGAIPFGRLKFGAAGALFVGLALSAWAPELGHGMHIVLSLGLALFVYTVGISAGQTFFSELRRQAPLLGASAIVIAIGAVVTIAGTHLLDLPKALSTGIFTGALTAAPALDTATRVTQSPQAAVGYAFGYPLAVLIAIVIVSFVTPRRWPGRKDSPSLASQGLKPITVQVQNPIPVRQIPGYREGLVRCSYLRRGDRVRVVAPGEDLEVGDRIVLVGFAEPVKEAIAVLGRPCKHHLADDRSEVIFDPVVLSNPELYGTTIASLNLPASYGATVTRVQRADLTLLAADSLHLEPGDTLSLVAPREEADAVKAFLGNSKRKVWEIDSLTIGLGMVLGLFAGMVSIPLPGGVVFSLGPAAGPLIVGMALGALRRTGPLVWILPQSANQVLRQVGLLFFLAGLGLTAGNQFVSLALTDTGLRAGILAIAIAVICCVGIALAARLLDLSAPRGAGAVAGLLGQPAVLQCANSLVPDERIESAYAALFAFGMIVKILFVPVIFAV